MSVLDTALGNPAGVIAAIAIVALFGVLSLFRLPVQLIPDVERPTLAIETIWRTASAQEIESEVLEPQERVLRGLPGIVAMQGSAFPASAFILLEFEFGTDMQATLIDVISRLNRVQGLPRDAEPPVVQLGGGGASTAESKALSWFFIQREPGHDRPMESFLPLIQDVVRPQIESVPGVAGVFISQTEVDELQIVFDPYRAAELGVQILDIGRIAGSVNDVSGGFVDVGRREYTLRFAGRYRPENLSELVLDWRDGRPVYLRDVATVQVSKSDRRSFAYQNGNPAIGLRVDRQPGENLLAALNRVKAEVAEIEADILEPEGLSIHQSFDASVFIYRAIALVTNNIVIGALLAVGTLWWFLRRLRATLVIAVAIPCSLLATFVVLSLTGRSINVISLAGIAFAVGMVLDAAIVVLENIVRHRARGLAPQEAAQRGTLQVWGALFASTVTTVAIFLPVAFVEDIEGQLFADLALTIAIAVTVSLVIATLILPAISTHWLAEERLEDQHAERWQALTQKIMTITGQPGRRVGIIAGLMVGSVALTYWAWPSLDYLPPVKRDSVDGFFNLPAGMAVDTIEENMAEVWIERLEPYMSGNKEPALRNYFIYLSGPWGGLMGARAKDQSQVKALEHIMRTEITAGIPDLFIFVQQGNLFGEFDGGRQVLLHVQARDPAALAAVAGEAQSRMQEALGVPVRVQPTLQRSQPELRLVPRDRALVEAGWSRTTFGPLVRAFGDGLYVGEYFDGERRLDTMLKSRPWDTPEELASLPVVAPSGRTYQLSQLVDLRRVAGPNQIFRLDGRRTVTLGVNVPDGIALESFLNRIRREVEPALSGMLPTDGALRYGGSASELTEAIQTMGQNFLLALGVLFIITAALFRSLKDSLLVMVTIPLATVGGALLLKLVNVFTFQPMDLLTMIGFIILLGLVVNNAILLVHQTRSAEREGTDRRAAVEQALLIRSRPILMSTLTSIVGMLPLLLFPGEGSTVYRGLAAAIVGGMAVSTAFTMLLLPALLRLGEQTPETEKAL
ncbi:MAG: efflux RND transporter permease subunit [Pseudomonadales bacterium]